MSPELELKPQSWVRGVFQTFVFTILFWEIMVMFAGLGRDIIIDGAGYQGKDHLVVLFILVNSTFLWKTLQPSASLETLSFACLWLCLPAIFNPHGVGGLQVLEQHFIVLMAGLIFSWLGLFLFRASGIRGRIFFVCLFSAIVPSVFLIQGLWKQYNLLDRHALWQITEEAVATQVARLDLSLHQSLSRAIARILGFSYPGKLMIRERSTEEIVRTAREEGFEDFEVVTVSCPGSDFGTPPLRLPQASVSGTPGSKPSKTRQRGTCLPGPTEPTFPPVPEMAAEAETMGRFRLGELGTDSGTLYRFLVKHGENRLETMASGSLLIISSLSGIGATETCLLAFPTPGSTGTSTLTVCRFPLTQWIARRVRSASFQDLDISVDYPFDPAVLGGKSRNGIKDKDSSARGSRRVILRGAVQDLQSDGQFSATITDEGSEWEWGKGRRWLKPQVFSKFPGRNMVFQDPDRGDSFFFAFEFAVSRNPFLVKISLSGAELVLKRSQVVIGYVGALGLLLSAMLSVFFSRTISDPLLEITAVARKIRDGDLDVDFPPGIEKDELGELTSTLSIMSERLKGRISVANQKLLNEKTKLEALVETTREGIFLITSEGRISFANPSARQWFGGETGRECEDKDFLAVLGSIGEKFQPPLPISWDSVPSGFHTVCELDMPREGEKKAISLYILALRRTTADEVPEPEEAGFLAVCRDITFERTVDRMKSEIVSMVSHELRTPLTSIQAYTEMILDEEADDPETRREYLGIIYDESERLTRLINEFLDLSRIESGRREMKPEKFCLCELTREIVKLLAGQAAEKALVLETALPETAIVTADKDLAKQAGLNLLSNAVKYTPREGRVKVSIEALSEDTRSGFAWRFEDTGIGLTPSEREKLFTKFFRSESEVVRSVKGTGLGLALVRQIVESHRWEIRVESTFGKGSSFTINLFEPGT